MFKISKINDNKIETIRYLDLFKTKNVYGNLSPFEICKTYPGDQSKKRRYLPVLDYIEIEKYFTHSKQYIINIFINKCLEKDYIDWEVPIENDNACYSGEVPVPLHLMINRENNNILAKTQTRGNRVIFHPDNIIHFSHYELTNPIHEDVITFYTSTSDMEFYSTSLVPRDKFIIYTSNEDVRKNLFQVIDGNIFFMAEDDDYIGTFLDSVSIINIKQNKFTLEERESLISKLENLEKTLEGISGNEIKKASLNLAERYKNLIIKQPVVDDTSKTSNKNLWWMCNRILEDNSMPIDKISRWIGFIQGTLACKGIIDVDTERDYSRPLFHTAYENSGIKIPKTIEMENTYNID